MKLRELVQHLDKPVTSGSLDVEIKGLCQLVLRHAAFNGTYDHEVLLNRRQAIDPFVVRERFVVQSD